MIGYTRTLSDNGGGGGGGGGSSEPYIYNVGRCGFNSGHKHTADTKIRFKALIDMYVDIPNSGWQAAFGARNGGYQNNSLGFFSRGSSSKFIFFRTGQEIGGDVITAPETSTSAPWLGEPCIFEATGKTLSWYREEIPESVRSLTASSANVNNGIAPLGIFCGNWSTSADGWSAGDWGNMHLYWFEIYEGVQLVKMFVPAYHNGSFCLYDEVGQDYIYDVVNNGQYLRGFKV